MLYSELQSGYEVLKKSHSKHNAVANKTAQNYVEMKTLPMFQSQDQETVIKF